MKTKNKLQNNLKLKLFGPGILLAIIFAGIFYFKNFLPQQKPIIIKNKISSDSYQKTILTPELNFLLDNKEKFNLNKNQFTQLKNLYKKYLVEAQPIKNQLNNESVNFSKFMQHNSNISITETKKQTQLTSELSKEFYELRKSYWEKAKLVLNNKQQELITRTLKNLKPQDWQKIYSRITSNEN